MNPVKVHPDALRKTLDGQPPASPASTARLADMPAPVAPEPALTEKESDAVDARQVQLMASDSPEGRPPTPWLRRREWRWALAAALVLIIGGVAVALIRGISPGEIIGLSVVVVLLLSLGGAPVLAAGLFRAKEQRAARAKAIAELPPTPIIGVKS